MSVTMALVLGAGVGVLLERLADLLPYLRDADDARARGCARPAWRPPHPGAALVLTLLTAALYGLVAWGWSLRPLEGLLVALSVTLMLLIGVIDWRCRLVPNLLVYPAALITLLVHLTLLHSSALQVMLGGGMAFGIFALVAALRPGDLGGGDVKLAGLIGLMCGFPAVLYALLVGGGLGGVTAAVLLRRQRAEGVTMAYAPFLCTGVIVVWVAIPFVT